MGITVVLIDHTGAERCSLDRAQGLVSTPMVMVAALGQRHS